MYFNFEVTFYNQVDKNYYRTDSFRHSFPTLSFKISRTFEL